MSDPGPTPKRRLPISLDEVTASNIKRLRADRGWSRQALADKLRSIEGRDVSRWRIVDLEGGRSRQQAPRAATWPELVFLALSFEVPIYELVLPIGDTRVVIAAATKTTHGSLPDGSPKTMSLSYEHRSTRKEMAEVLFSLPAESLTPEYLEKIAERFDFDLEDALTDIRNTQEELQRGIERVEQLSSERPVHNGGQQ